MVIAENKAFNATPASMTLVLSALFRLDIASTKIIQRAEATKEHSAVNKEPASIPRPDKTIIAILAPSAEAEEIPIVEGEANGLLRDDCIIIPDKAMPMPTKKPPKILGSLIPNTIRLLLSFPFPIKVNILSLTVMSEEPTLTDIIVITINAITSAIKKPIFCEILFLYCSFKSI